MRTAAAIALVAGMGSCAPEETDAGRQQRQTHQQVRDAHGETQRLLLEAQRQTREQMRQQGYKER